MAKLLSHIVRGQHLILSGERTLFWEDERTLIAADLHVGKTGHFRKEGIGVPQAVYRDDLHRLLSEILFFKAERLVIVGDLTHSIVNREMDLFRRWRKDFPLLEVVLAKGNHDILDNKWYEEADIMVCNEAYERPPFVFVHDIIKRKNPVQSEQFIFSGHVHPSVTLRGRGRQSLSFPCFYFTDEFCVLPAFSRFTGGYGVDPDEATHVFAIAEKEVVPIG